MISELTQTHTRHSESPYLGFLFRCYSDPEARRPFLRPDLPPAAHPRTAQGKEAAGTGGGTGAFSVQLRDGYPPQQLSP